MRPGLRRATTTTLDDSARNVPGFHAADVSSITKTSTEWVNGLDEHSPSERLLSCHRDMEALVMMFLCNRFLFTQVNDNYIERSASKDVASVIIGDRQTMIGADIDSFDRKCEWNRFLDSAFRDGFAID